MSKRDIVVLAVKSREGKNQYTQGDKRTQCGSGYSDCSALQQWAYHQAGIEIGSYTGAQIVKGEWVTKGGSYPDESKLKPGDLLFFSCGYDNGRSYNVGHVEMYVGNGQISGHGSGIGPTRKNMIAYCNQRNAAGKNYIGVKRYIKDEDNTSSGNSSSGSNTSSGSGNGGSGYMIDVPNLVKGNTGNAVKLLQRLLIGHGYSVGTAGVDGSFGGDTEKAVKKFQENNGIKVNYPGTVGSKTWSKLVGL